MPSLGASPTPAPTTSSAPPPRAMALIDPFSAPLVSLAAQPAIFLFHTATQASMRHSAFVTAAQLVSSRDAAAGVHGSVRSTGDTAAAATPAASDRPAPRARTPGSGPSVTEAAVNESLLRLASRDLRSLESSLLLQAGTADSQAATPPTSNTATKTSTPPTLTLPSSVRDIGYDAIWSLSSAKLGNGIAALRDGSTETFWQSDGGQPHCVNLQFNTKTRIQCVSFYVDYKLDESYTPCKVAVRAGTNVEDLHDLAVIELEEPTGWITLQTRQPKPTFESLGINKENHISHRATSTKHSSKSSAGPLNGPVFSPASFFSPALTVLQPPTNRGAPSSSQPPSATEDASAEQWTYLRCHYLQISVLASHQNGKDTHIRQVRVFGPAAVTASSESYAGTASAMLIKDPVFVTEPMFSMNNVR